MTAEALEKLLKTFYDIDEDFHIVNVKFNNELNSVIVYAHGGELEVSEGNFQLTITPEVRERPLICEDCREKMYGHVLIRSDDNGR